MAEIMRGNHETLVATIRDDEGELEDLTGKTLWFTAKRKLTDPDAAAIIAKKSGEGIDILELGKAVIEIDPADTAALPNRDTTLYCDVQVLEGGKIRTPVKDTLLVTYEVTWATS
jgi:hypothetical protein